MTIAQGQPILAKDVLAIQSAGAQNTHNILQLYVQQYLDGNAVDYNGLFFDGFSDNTRIDDINDLLLLASASGQKDVTVRQDNDYNVGDEYILDNGTIIEKATVASITDQILYPDEFTDDFNRADDGNVGNGWGLSNDNAVDLISNQIRCENPNGDGHGALYRVANADNSTASGKKYYTGYDMGGRVSIEFKFDQSTGIASGNSQEVRLALGRSGYYDTYGVQIELRQTSNGDDTYKYEWRFHSYNSGSVGTWQEITIDLDGSDWGVLELIVTKDYFTWEARQWAKGGTRPANSQLTRTLTKAESDHFKQYYDNQYQWMMLTFRNQRSNSYGNKYIYADNFLLEQVDDRRTLTMENNLSNSFAINDSIYRSTVGLDTTNKKIAMGGKNADFSDDFDRADNSTVGGGWTGQASNDSNMQVPEIYSNALRFKTTQNTTSNRWGYVEKDLGQDFNDGYKITAKFAMDTNNNDGTRWSDLRFLIGNYQTQAVDNGVVVRKYTGASNNNVEIFVQKYWEGKYDIQTVLTGIGTELGTDATPYNIEILIPKGIETAPKTIKVWLWEEGTSKPSNPTYTSSQQFSDSDGGQTGKLTIASVSNNSTNGKHTRVFEYTAEGIVSFGDGKSQVYYSKKQQYQQAMDSVRVWVTRNFEARYNPDTAPSGTTVKIDGDHTTQFVVGDTVDVYTADNTSRERRTISAIDYNTTTTGKTTITLDSALTGSYTTSDYIERVDALPKCSLVDSGANSNFEAMTFVKSELDSVNGEVQDEYVYTPSSAGHDLMVQLELTRNDVTTTPYAKVLLTTLTAQ